MLDWLGNLAGAVFGGGITGILGVVVQRFFDLKNKDRDLELVKVKNAHELQLKQVDLQIMNQEWAQRVKVAEVEAAGHEAVADSQAFAASFNEPQRYAAGASLNPAQTWLMVILDFVRGIIRPGLTLYLCLLTTLVYFQAREVQLQAWPAPDEAYGIVKQVIGTILYLFTTCLLWWFGVRNKQKGPA